VNKNKVQVPAEMHAFMRQTWDLSAQDFGALVRLLYYHSGTGSMPRSKRFVEKIATVPVSPAVKKYLWNCKDGRLRFSYEVYLRDLKP